MSKPLQVVLIVDDSSDDNYFMKRRLKDAGIAEDVVDFVYAADALEFMRRRDRPKVDLILLDLNMPRMNGFEFATEYRKLAPSVSEAPIYMVSSSLDPADREQAETHPGIRGFYVKPPSVEQLHALCAAGGAREVDSAGEPSAQA